MQRIRLLIPLAALVATITLGFCWNMGTVQAEAECNCIDGSSGRDGVYGWDPIQQRYKCVTAGCYVITE